MHILVHKTLLFSSCMFFRYVFMNSEYQKLTSYDISLTFMESK